MNPPTPKDEPDRIKALQDFKILDTPPEAGFDRLAQLAAHTFKVPISAISLVDHDRQWFKSSVGLEICGCPRNDAFCTYSILHSEITVVEDALLDERFCKNPMVIGPPAIRFYAAAPLTTSDGLRLGTLCIIDVKPRRLIQSEQEILTEMAAVVMDRLELRRASLHMPDLTPPIQATGKILVDMSHEIRTPLNSILGFSRLLQSAPSLSAQQRQFVETINRNGEHLLSLINDVLEMSRIEAGRDSLNLGPCAVASLAEELGRMFRGLAEEKGLDLAITLSPELPPWVQADETKLRQVLINLLGNAVKFTESGRIELRVSSPATAQGNVRVQFEVADTGIGLDDSEQKRVFDAFEQTVDGKQQAASTGLGLAISREQVKLMGGELQVASAKGEGSVFRFAIETGASCVSNPSAATSRPRLPVALSPQDQGTRILIVEDNEGNRTLLANMLRPLGFELRETSNGHEAILACAEFNPRIILMDLRMPELNGVEAIRRIRGAEAESATPSTIIGVSASVFEEEAGLMLAAGCNAFVRKPFRSAALLEAIAEHSGIEYQFPLEGDFSPPSVSGREA